MILTQGEPSPPVLLVRLDDAPAEVEESRGRVGVGERLLEPSKGQIRTLRSDAEYFLPCGDGLFRRTHLQSDVAEIEIGRHRALVEVDRRFEVLGRCAEFATPHRLETQFVLQEGQNRLVPVAAGVGGHFRHPLTEDLRFTPLVLLLVELLQVEQGILIARVELDNLREGLEGPVYKSTPPEVQPEAE